MNVLLIGCLFFLGQDSLGSSAPLPDDIPTEAAPKTYTVEPTLPALRELGPKVQITVVSLHPNGAIDRLTGRLVSPDGSPFLIPRSREGKILYSSLQHEVANFKIRYEWKRAAVLPDGPEKEELQDQIIQATLNNIANGFSSPESLDYLDPDHRQRTLEELRKAIRPRQPPPVQPEPRDNPADGSSIEA